MTPRLSTLVFASILASSLMACASSLPMGSAKIAALDGSRVLVCPFNLGIRRAPELDDTTGPVAGELIDTLEKAGAEVFALSHEESLQLWQEAYEAGPSDSGFYAAAARFVRLAAEENDFDFVLMPSLILRGAEVKGHRASWDGVRRSLPMDAAVADPSFDVSGVRAHELTGTVSAVSIHLVVLEPSGAVAFQGMGGLDVIQEAHRGAAGDADRWQLAPRKQPLRDLDLVRQGIELAFERDLPKTARAWGR